MVQLDLSSEDALWESIKIKYAKNSPEVQKATFEDMKQYIGWDESQLDGCHIGK